MENLTEEDFNDAAAAVEGVYGSDEDARVRHSYLARFSGKL